MLSAEQVTRLIETAASAESPALALRDTALVELLYGAGLRIAEVVSIRVRDLDLARGEVRVTGKGEKQRVALFGAPCINALPEHTALHVGGGCERRSGASAHEPQSMDDADDVVQLARMRVRAIPKGQHEAVPRSIALHAHAVLRFDPVR